MYLQFALMLGQSFHEVDWMFLLLLIIVFWYFNHDSDLGRFVSLDSLWVNKILQFHSFLFALKAEFLLLLNWRIKEDLRSDIFIHNSIKHKRSLQGNTCCSHTSSQFCLPQRLEEGYCWYLLCHVTYYIRMQIGVSTIYVAYLPYQEVGRIFSAEHILPFPAVPLLHSGDRLQRIIPQLCILSH